MYINQPCFKHRQRVFTRLFSWNSSSHYFARHNSPGLYASLTLYQTPPPSDTMRSFCTPPAHTPYPTAAIVFLSGEGVKTNHAACLSPVACKIKGIVEVCLIADPGLFAHQQVMFPQWEVKIRARFSEERSEGEKWCSLDSLAGNGMECTFF